MPNYFMFNKPRGCVSARRDERHKTVMDYFPEALRDTCFPVGRLDKDTEGLLLITDDGKLTKAILTPENRIEKTYYFLAEGALSEEKISEVEAGVKIYKNREAITAPSKIDIIAVSTIGEAPDILSEEDRKIAVRKPYLPTVSGTVRVTEGKKHEVKRMIRYAGARVMYLKRTKIATLTLDVGLDKGEYRPLTSEELSALISSVADYL